ncbi:MAG TPA: type I restriction endonuclease, partial [Ktedonobacteraceae bacterium]|nr:type I restriction endonuclease [Ktedonobacteraceae bacterium]
MSKKGQKRKSLYEVGQPERSTQVRVVGLLQDLGYRYLGYWEDREQNSNVEVEMLRTWLEQQGYEKTLIDLAIAQLTKVTGNQNKSLYDLNKEVYSLLRYGVKVKPGIDENTVTVWLIDWKQPRKNDFAIAEEVT